MRLAIVGAGAVGLLFAAKMTHTCASEVQSDCSVTLVTRTERQAQELRKKGLVLHENSGCRTVYPDCRSWEDADRWRAGESWDWIMLAVKQTHLQPAFIRRLAVLFPEGRILCLQNGIGHREALAGYFGESRIYSAVTTEAALKSGENEVEHTGEGTTFVGRIDGHSGGTDAAGEQLINFLHAAGFVAELSKNIECRIWNKLLVNSVINPLTALFRVTNGKLLRSPEWRELMRTLLDEGVSVARAEGIAVAEDLWEQTVEVCRRTAPNRSSMLQDMQRGIPTEIDAINGSLVRMAEQHHLAVPVQKAVFQMIKGMEAGG